MIITFFSNFLNHHQLPFCLELLKLVGEGNFHFVSSERIHTERAQMGYDDMNVKYPFVVRAYESKDQMERAIRLAHESDVAIIGSSSKVFTQIRGEENKLTFFFMERIFKNGAWHRFYPPTALKIYNSYTRYRNRNFYVLCASAYTADDMEKCLFPRKKCLKWGYFPELLPKVGKQYDKLRIMWCGRMLWWKHPEDAIEVARMLSEKGVDFEMKMIGNGEKREVVERMIDRYGLRSQIHTFDYMNPADIRKEMNKSNVYLFTSGKQEGWGVVLNEAMNSGCIVIANRNAGSAPFLIEDGVSGIIYDGSHESLQKAVDKLLVTDMPKMSDAAYQTLATLWNPKEAADRFIKLSKIYLTGQVLHNVYDDGPCATSIVQK